MLNKQDRCDRTAPSTWLYHRGYHSIADRDPPRPDLSPSTPNLHHTRLHRELQGWWCISNVETIKHTKLCVPTNVVPLPSHTQTTQGDTCNQDPRVKPTGQLVAHSLPIRPGTPYAHTHTHFTSLVKIIHTIARKSMQRQEMCTGDPIGIASSCTRGHPCVSFGSTSVDVCPARDASDTEGSFKRRC